MLRRSLKTEQFAVYRVALILTHRGLSCCIPRLSPSESLSWGGQIASDSLFGPKMRFSSISILKEMQQVATPGPTRT